MFRLFKFRGKDYYTRRFIYGDLVHDEDGGCLILSGTISDYKPDFSLVDIDTVGQFTGLKDAKRVEIYDGDVIASGENNEIKHIVTYLESEAKYVGYYSKDDYCGIDQKWIDEFKKVIIGNIYDNPELNYK